METWLQTTTHKEIMRGTIGISKISETSAEIESSDGLSPWMNSFVNSVHNAETAVEQARKRQIQQASIVNQINNVMANPPRYATVEDAVADMRDRTGLNTYLITMKQAEQKSKLKKIIAQFNSEELVNVPESLKKYGPEAVEQIINFVRNTLDNNRTATVPQLQYDLIKVIGSQLGIDYKDIENEEVISFLNNMILDNKLSNPQQIENSSNIGAGVGTTEEADGNQNWMENLVTNSK
jgi:hypothetical protein